MARWHVIPILAATLLAGASLVGAAQAQPDAKPGFSFAAPSYESPAPRRRVYRGPSEAEIAPAPAFVVPPPAYAGRSVQRASPNDPYSGLNLPRQSGDAAYQGGGMVLEQDDSGVNRRIR